MSKAEQRELADTLEMFANQIRDVDARRLDGALSGPVSGRHGLMSYSHDFLREWSQDFRDGILNGGSSARMCFAVSAALGGALRALLGIESKLVEGDFGSINHVWLELPDGTILDATADQFGGPPVYIGPLTDVYRRALSGDGNP